MNDFLLTIAIPTYNRSKFLDRNLEYLYLQNEDLGSVEIIVSDNASPDDTTEVVIKYISLGLNIKYIKNPENKGADLNIAQCYIMAAGKYVLTLGDDDFLVKGAVASILNLLKTGDYGVVYLNSGKIDNYESIKPINYVEYDDAIKFIKKLNYNVTFISGNIVNRKYLNEQKLLKYIGTNIIQVSFIVDAILASKKNVFINTILLYVEPDNTGGYNLFEIFGKNFYYIIKDLQVDKNVVNKIVKIIDNALLTSFFPIHILRMKLNKKNKFVNKNPVLFLKPIFKHYFDYWLCCYILYILPDKVSILYSYFIKAYAKIKLI